MPKLPRPSWALLAVLVTACFPAPHTEELVVTATAYTSHPSETSGDPWVAAWGDRLRPGLRGLAVSPDLEVRGLVRGTRVRIEGVDGVWTVLDRTAPRLRRRIDLYMGDDRAAARRFGRRRVRIYWSPPDADERDARLPPAGEWLVARAGAVRAAMQVAAVPTREGPARTPIR